MDPPPAEPAGETATRSDTRHPAQSWPDPDPWSVTHVVWTHGFDTCGFGVRYFTTENEYTPLIQSARHLKAHLRPLLGHLYANN